MAKSKYPRQIVINDPLREFVEHCEVYCSAACCELKAFELHPALLLRLCIDKNLAGEDGGAAFREAWEQLLLQQYQQVTLGREGRSTISAFDLDAARKEAWIRWNEERDRDFYGE